MMRRVLALEVLYMERGDAIDSLMVALANCDSAFAIGFKGFEREREAWRLCDEVNRSMMRLNYALIDELADQRRRKAVWIGATAILSATTIYLTFNR